MIDKPLHLYTIPPGIGFAEHFAARLLQEYAGQLHRLPEMLVLLPTRRACRVVRDAFLRQSDGAGLLLPRLQTLGDIDEDALGLEVTALSATGQSLDIPPSISPLQRRIILTRLIMARPDYAHPADQALLLADGLGKLLDRIHTEGLNIKDLPDIIDEEQYARHWQITLKFLTIISEVWPAILAEKNYIDTADRRNRLLLALANHWTEFPPSYPVIAAGSTGSIPAAGNLLQVIAGLPQGRIVLPGLDQHMDERSWRLIDASHPQATMKRLLDRMGADRSQVLPWDFAEPVCGKLATEIMRPAETTDLWRGLRKNAAVFEKMLHGLQRLDCATAQEEARLITMIFRHVQHQPGKTAALVTFDRNLARRVAACCARWGLKIDDSGGEPLDHTIAGSFFNLCIQACVEELAPTPLLSLLKHQRLSNVHFNTDLRSIVRRLDHNVLRGYRPAPGIKGLRDRAPELKAFIAALEKCLSPLLSLCNSQKHDFSDFLEAHITVTEGLAGSAEILWQGEDGEALALFLTELREQAGDLPPIRAADYLPMLQTFMKGIMVRPAWGTHPRLSILGPLEARLLQADIVILGGLNEGSWPPQAESDPWMSRPMREKFGLPAPEQSIGLSAHDFVQCFCTKQVILTRAERAGTAPTIPSRWLQRLDAVLAAAGLSLPHTDWMQRSRLLDEADNLDPISRPAPRPPVDKRPAHLSITDIETWMRDPYALYAKHVLSLRAIDPIDQLPGAANLGTIIHNALERFIGEYPKQLPEDSIEILTGLATGLLADQIADHRTRHFWQIRFDKAATWLVPYETAWRSTAKPLKSEIRGRMALPGHNFHLTAKADRIDVLHDGSGVAIIDYKTGTVPSKKDIVAGLSPQLPLEAAMIRTESFDGIAEMKIGYLGHWVLSGRQGGREDRVKGLPHDLADAALAGLQNLVSHFASENTPYYSIPRPAARPRYSDYTHLARIQEWAVLDDTESGEE